MEGKSFEEAYLSIWSSQPHSKDDNDDLNNDSPEPEINIDETMSTNYTDYFFEREKQFIDDSIIFKSFRSEYEQDNAFTKEGCKYLLEKQKGPVKETLNEKRKGGNIESIPGYSETAYMLKKSLFTKEEMNRIFDIFLRMQKNKTHCDQYNIYRDRIKIEQKEYLDYAKERWLKANYTRHREITQPIECIMNNIWEERLKRVTTYPKFYSQVTLPSLVSSNDISMTFCSTLKEVGLPTYMFFRNFYLNRVFLTSVVDHLAKQEMSKKLQKDCESKYSPEVSEDKYAEELALENDINVVITSSGFKRLLDNHYPSFDSSWDLPVIVKEYTLENGTKRTVVYINKALPPRVLNIADRNRWYYKMANNYHFQDHKKKARHQKRVAVNIESSSGLNSNVKVEKSEPENLEYFEDHEPDKTYGLEINHEGSSDNSNDSDSSVGLLIDEEFDDAKRKVKKRKLNKTPILPKQNIMETKPTKLCQQVINTSKEEKLNNIAYRLWNLKKDASYLSKSYSKDLTVLVRTKEGFILPKNQQKYKWSSKLEYQSDMGAEAMTLSEITQEWASLFIRPGTMLARSRIIPSNGEVFMVDKRNLGELTAECSRLHNVNLTGKLGSLYNVFEKLVNLQPGNYHLCHCPKNEAFVQLLKETDGAYTFALHSGFASHTTDIAPERSPWIPLDTSIIIPVFRHFHRIPCTFIPKCIYGKKNDNLKKGVADPLKRGKKPRKRFNKAKKKKNPIIKKNNPC